MPDWRYPPNGSSGVPSMKVLTQIVPARTPRPTPIAVSTSRPPNTGGEAVIAGICKLDRLLRVVECESDDNGAEDFGSRDLHRGRHLVDDGRGHEEAARFEPGAAGADLGPILFGSADVPLDLAEMIG